MISLGHLHWDSSHPAPSIPPSSLATLSTLSISSLEYLPDNILLLGTVTGVLLILRLSPHHNSNLLSSQIIRIINPPTKEKLYHHEITVMRASPCHRYLAIGFLNGLVLVFQLNQLKNLQIIHQYHEHKLSKITALCWSIDSCKLFSGDANGLLVELNLAENPAIDVMAFAASLFGFTSTLRIGECKVGITAIDYYFSPSDSTLKSTDINPASLFSSFISSATSNPSTEMTSGDNLLVSCLDHRVLQFRLFRNGTKHAKMMSLNDFVQRSRQNLTRNGLNNSSSKVNFSFGCYFPRDRFPSLSSISSGNSSSLILLFSADSPEIFVCDFLENSISHLHLKELFQDSLHHHEKSIAFEKLLISKGLGPTSEYFVLTTCHQVGVIDISLKTFRLFNTLGPVSSLLHTPSSLVLYLRVINVADTHRGVVGVLAPLGSVSKMAPLFQRSIHRSFSIFKERWKYRRQVKSFQKNLMLQSPLRSPIKSKTLKQIFREIRRESSAITPTFQSVELLLQQNLRECDLLLERINLDAIDALHAPSLKDIEDSTERSLLKLASPVLRSPIVNYDHNSQLSSVHDDDIAPPLHIHSYASLSSAQSARLLSLNEHFDITSLSKKMFFKDFMNLLDSLSSLKRSEESSSIKNICRYGELLKQLGDHHRDMDSSGFNDPLQSLIHEVDELCLLSKLFITTVDKESYDSNCKFFQPNQKLLQEDHELLHSLQLHCLPLDHSCPQFSALHKSPTQLDHEVTLLIEKTNEILSGALTPVLPRRQRSYSLGCLGRSISKPQRTANDISYVLVSPVRPHQNECHTLDLNGHQPISLALSESAFPSTEVEQQTPSPCPDQADGDDPDWRNTNETWLDRWQECSPNSALHEIKTRLLRKRSSRKILCVPQDIQGQVEQEETLISRVRDDYQVTLKCGSHGLGLNLNLNAESILTVTGFSPMPLGVTNPARSCRMIAKGDMLIKINDFSLLDYEPNESIEVMKSMLSSRINVKPSYSLPLLNPLVPAICYLDIPLR